ncbi:MAG TPA: DUF1634 domain-containing protein [Bryobacteraceae bacterium]|nr:DUF1634 domain-containing protein [Bryobacteraceae bacterium]
MMAATVHRDARIELLLGSLLRAGVLLAAAVVFLGAIVYLASHGSEQRDYRTFQQQDQDLRGIAGVMRGAGSFDGAAIIQLGLLLLIATPILRVATSAYAFARQRDRRYVVITLVVLGILSYGLLASR